MPVEQQRERSVRAIFMRGGTSKGLFFHLSDLPRDAGQRDALLLAAMGSPDPYARQLDGMGGGISSLSKVVIVQPSVQHRVDIEYTFGQVSIQTPVIHYEGVCGNLTAAVPLFAIEEGLIHPPDGTTTIHMLNRNTRKLVRATLPVQNGSAVIEGEFAIDGVVGCGARIEIEFLDPGGSVTGKLLPTGRETDTLEVASIGRIPASIIDAAGLVVFVRADSLGLRGNEDPRELAADGTLMERVEAVRAAGAIKIGMVDATDNTKAGSQAYPAIMLVSSAPPPSPAYGRPASGPCPDIVARAFSMGVPHPSVPMADAMCLAVAAKMGATVVHDIMGPQEMDDAITIGHPTGLCRVKAKVHRPSSWHVISTTADRTARRLMSGLVHVPASKLAALDTLPTA